MQKAQVSLGFIVIITNIIVIIWVRLNDEDMPACVQEVRKNETGDGWVV